MVLYQRPLCWLLAATLLSSCEAGATFDDSREAVNSLDTTLTVSLAADDQAPGSAPSDPPAAAAGNSAAGPANGPAASPTNGPAAASIPAAKPAPSQPPKLSGAGQPAGTTVKYQNPVLARNFPDPGVTRVGAHYYAFATNGGGSNVQAATSPDLVHWTMQPDALPHLPSWAESGRTWAPEVIAGPHGFLLYVSIATRASGRVCLGAGHSDAPGGPFQVVGAAPLICPIALGGAIDPSPYVAPDGSRYLVYKNDGNAIGLAPTLWLQRLSADGLSLVGTPLALLHRDRAWEGAVIEAPFLYVHGGAYSLFFSANNYADNHYAIGYGTSAALGGPYSDPSAVWRGTSSNHGEVLGPGGQTVVVGPDGDDWLVYHSRVPGQQSRSMCIAPLTRDSSGLAATLSWGVPMTGH